MLYQLAELELRPVHVPTEGCEEEEEKKEEEEEEDEIKSCKSVLVVAICIDPSRRGCRRSRVIVAKEGDRAQEGRATNACLTSIQGGEISECVTGMPKCFEGLLRKATSGFTLKHFESFRRSK